MPRIYHSLIIGNRFQRIKNRLPKRILLLRDGLVQCDEFEETIAALKIDNIAFDLSNIYQSRQEKPKFQKAPGILLRKKSLLLLAKSNQFKLVIIGT